MELMRFLHRNLNFKGPGFFLKLFVVVAWTVFSGGGGGLGFRVFLYYCFWVGFLHRDPQNGTLTYQNLLFCRVLINCILGFIIRTYKKVGFGSLRYTL